MPVHVGIGIAAISLALPLLLWALFARPDKAHEAVVTNLRRGLPLPVTVASHSDQPAARGRTPLLRVMYALTPPGFVRRLDRLLSRAGRPAAWSLDRCVSTKILLAVVLGGLSVLYASEYPSRLADGVGVFATVVGYFLPELLLHSRGQERREEIALSLADTLDQMTISVEAGLSFDSAMARAAKNGKGPLGEELSRTLQDMQVGRSRKQAFQALADRASVPDLRRFVRAVVQADSYGVPVAEVLRTQAAELRVKRRQRAEEKAMQIPVKVVFPLMLCILPVLFIVLLGPAAMDIMAAFK